MAINWQLIASSNQFNRSRGWLNRGGELSTSSADVNDVNAVCFRAIYSNRTFP